MSLEQEIVGSEGSRLYRRMQSMRAVMGKRPVLLLLYRVLITVLGFLCIVAGLIMLVTPGPGWLFIFMGMGLWGSEFHWAHRLNLWARAKVLAAWRSFEAARRRRHRKKIAARWAKRSNQNHYCPDGQHYH